MPDEPAAQPKKITVEQIILYGSLFMTVLSVAGVIWGWSGQVADEHAWRTFMDTRVAKIELHNADADASREARYRELTNGQAVIREQQVNNTNRFQDLTADIKDVKSDVKELISKIGSLNEAVREHTK